MRRLFRRLLLVISVSLALTSCFTSRQFVPLALENGRTATDARIYVLRSASVFGSAFPFAIYSDSIRVGELGALGYLCWQVKEGDHLVAIGSETKKTYPLAVRAGEDYYFRAVPQIGIFIPRAKLKPIPFSEAMTRLVKIQRPVVN